MTLKFSDAIIHVKGERYEKVTDNSVTCRMPVQTTAVCVKLRESVRTEADRAAESRTKAARYETDVGRNTTEAL